MILRSVVRSMKFTWAVFLLVCVQTSTAQIVNPGRAAPRIVKRSEIFSILCREEPATIIESVVLQGPYNRIRLEVVGQTRGHFEYDSYTRGAANLKIRVKTPSAAPEELYDLVVSSAKNTFVSKNAVKVVKEFKQRHTIILISDPHITRQWAGPPEQGYGIELERFDNFVRVANLLNPDFVVCAGDLIHDYTRIDADKDGWGGQARAKAAERPYADEKWKNYYEGASGYLGLHGLRAPAFSLAGNHDYYGVDGQERAAQWNQYCGLRVYGIPYGTTRLLVMDNFLSGNPHPDDQLAILEAFLKKEGPGSLRILAQHDHTRFPADFLNRQKVQLAFVGHTHTPRIWRVDGTSTQVTSPGSVSKSGEKDPQMGWFRIIWADGESYALSPDLKYCSNSPGLPHAEQKLNLTVEYERPNDGRAISNRATLRNEFGIDLSRCRVRFVMKKGRYRVAGGVIDQIIEGKTVTVLDIDADVGRRGAAEVRVFPRQFRSLHRAM